MITLLSNRLSVFQFIVLMIALHILSGCSSSTYLAEREREFGTTGENKWVFHRLSDREQGEALAFPGYIVALEATRRDNIGAPSIKSLKKNSALDMFGFKDSVCDWNEMRGQEKILFNDKKPTFVSAIFEYQLEDSFLPHMQKRTIYNSYDPAYLPDARDAYTSGLEELKAFGDEILARIRRDGITHVFLFSMGWNTDQQEALCNYNDLYINLMREAHESGAEINPLFIGLTWASKWHDGMTNSLSIISKSNDADEIGMFWVNTLLNSKLLSMEVDLPFRTVLIGHSLGGKLTSRGVMSAGMLEKKSKPVDLLINLEPAYSINRYSITKGIEKLKNYREWYKHANHIALTWSEHDSATKKAFWTWFAGSEKGYNKVVKDPAAYPTVETVTYDPAAGIAFDTSKQLLLIDGSAIVKTPAYNRGGNAHSDIYDREMARMMWELIESSTMRTWE